MLAIVDGIVFRMFVIVFVGIKIIVEGMTKVAHFRVRIYLQALI